MTVQELIDALTKVEDKTREVQIDYALNKRCVDIISIDNIELPLDTIYICGYGYKNNG